MAFVLCWTKFMVLFILTGLFACFAEVQDGLTTGEAKIVEYSKVDLSKEGFTGGENYTAYFVRNVSLGLQYLKYPILQKF